MLITWSERCQKSKGRQGEKEIARSLKHHETVHGQPCREGKLFPNRRLSSVNNGLIAGLSTHHNQSENKTRSEGEAGEILGGRLNLHGNVVFKVLKLCEFSLRCSNSFTSFLSVFLARSREKEARKEPEGEVSFCPPSSSTHLVLCLGHGRPSCKSLSLLKGPDLAEMSREVTLKHSRGLSALCMEAAMAWGLREVIRGTVFLPSSLWLCNSSVSSVPFLQPAGTLWGSWAPFQAAELKPGGGQDCPASALALPDCGVPGSLVKNCLELCGIKWAGGKRVHFCWKKIRSFVSGLIYLTPSQRCSFTYGLVFILVFGKKIIIHRCQPIPFQN